MSPSAQWKHCSTSDLLQRSSHSVNVVDATAYVFGGELLPRQPRDDQVFKIDLKASGNDDPNRLEIVSTSPPPRVGSASTVLDGKIYMFSGRGGEDITKPIDESGSIWMLDPSRSTWSLLEPVNSSDPVPQPRSYHCAASNGSELIYIHAGCPATGRLSDLWSFNVKTRTWTQLADAPAPPRGGPSIAYTNDRLYRMNGFDGQKEQGGMLDIYNPETNTWDFQTFTADGVSGPAPRSVGTLLPVNVKGQTMLVTLFGEGDPSALGHAGAGSMFDDVWAYSINHEKWFKVDAKHDYDQRPSARGWFGADKVDESTIVVAGGLAADNQRLQDCWLLEF